MPLPRFFPRDSRELLIDSALTLTLYHLTTLVTGRTGHVGDRLKAAKLVFYAAYPWYRERLKAFSYTFHKYTHGPFTRELHETWGDLGWSGLLSVASGPSIINVTEEGAKVADSFLTEVLGLPENTRYLEELVNTALSHARKSTSQVTNECYAMEVVPVGESESLTIREVPENTLLTKNLSQSKARDELTVPERWLQQFDIDRKISQSAGTPTEEFVRLHTPESISEVEDALRAYERGEGRRVTRQELMDALQPG